MKKTHVTGVLCFAAGLLAGGALSWGVGKRCATEPEPPLPLPKPAVLPTEEEVVERPEAPADFPMEVPATSEVPGVEEVEAGWAAAIGLAPTREHGPLVIVPAGLIEHLSHNGQRRSLEHDLFSNAGVIEAHLQINDSEKAKIQEFWRQLRREIRALEKDSAEVVEREDGILEVVVPDIRRGGEALEDRFFRAATEVLGINRSEVFFAAVQADRALWNAGGAKSIQVWAEETGNGGLRYHIDVHGSGGKKSYVGERVPTELEHITGYLEILQDPGAEFEE